MFGTRLFGAVIAAGALSLSPPANAEGWQNSVQAPAARETPKYAHDAWLEGRLETVFVLNRYLHPFPIDVAVNDGSAILTGSVASVIERELAADITMSIAGIHEVDNELDIDPAAARDAEGSAAYDDGLKLREGLADANLSARVRNQLLANSSKENLSIDVNTKNGVITLSGAVSSSEKKELMARIAGNASGAQSVVNELVVETEEAE